MRLVHGKLSLNSVLWLRSPESSCHITKQVWVVIWMQGSVITALSSGPTDAHTGMRSCAFPSVSAQWPVDPVGHASMTEAQTTDIWTARLNLAELCCKKETGPKIVPIVQSYRAESGGCHGGLQCRSPGRSRRNVPECWQGSLLACSLGWPAGNAGTRIGKLHGLLHEILDHVTQLAAWMVNLGKRAFKNLFCV